MPVGCNKSTHFEFWPLYRLQWASRTTNPMLKQRNRPRAASIWLCANYVGHNEVVIDAIMLTLAHIMNRFQSRTIRVALEERSEKLTQRFWMLFYFGKQAYLNAVMFEILTLKYGVVPVFKQLGSGGVFLQVLNVHTLRLTFVLVFFLHVQSRWMIEIGK